MPVYKLMIILLSLISFMQCGDDNPPGKSDKTQDQVVLQFDSTDLATETITDSAKTKSFSLAYNFKVGEKFTYRLTSLSRTKQTMETDSVESNIINIELTRILHFEILSVENDSTSELRCNISDIFMNSKVNEQIFAYQSGNELDSLDAMRYRDQVCLINNPFNIRISKHGELLDIYKADGIVNKMLELSGYKDSISIQEKAMYRSEILNNLLKPLVTQIFYNFPANTMSIGSSWKKTLPPVPVKTFNIAYTNNYSISNIELLGDEMLAVINNEVSSSINGQSKYSYSGLDYEFDKPLTEVSSKLYFNIDSGLVQKSKNQTKVFLKYHFQMNSPEGKRTGKITEDILNKTISELL